jgi:hypothetical protein
LNLYATLPSPSSTLANNTQSHKDLPSQFLRSSKPIEAKLLIGSFGSSQGYNDRLFSINIATDPSSPIPTIEKPLRYGKLPEIHHIFKSDPTSPSIVFSLLFTIAVLATLPAVIGLVSSCVFHTMRGLINPLLYSGYILVAMSTIFRKLSNPRPSHTRFSTAQSWALRAYSFCTIPAGTCSRLCLCSSQWGVLPSSVELER